jgi:hypothetical protein
VNFKVLYIRRGYDIFGSAVQSWAFKMAIASHPRQLHLWRKVEVACESENRNVKWDREVGMIMDVRVGRRKVA